MVTSDEKYIIELCDSILNEKSLRQHRFDFLLGDPNRSGKCRKLPVDAYYKSKNLVIEYHERQHTEAVPHFDKRFTISGISRREQRLKYDLRRQEILTKHGIGLVTLCYLIFAHESDKRLVRVPNEDSKIIKERLKSYLS